MPEAGDVSRERLLMSVADCITPWCNTVLAPKTTLRIIIARTAELIHISRVPLSRRLWLGSRRTGGRNTTKCDSEKLTRKLAPIASSLPASTGMTIEATTVTAVLATRPATCDSTKLR
jgi:hypothetical protein